VKHRQDMILRRCQRPVWRGFAFDLGARVVSERLMLWPGGGGGHGGRELGVASSEAEVLIEGCPGWKPDGLLRLLRSWAPPCTGP
jgi:hypothetical protein